MLRRALLILTLLLAAAAARAEGQVTEVVRLASLEWPPYSGEALPMQGASLAVVRAALASRGHGLVVEFVPFTQAIGLAQDSQGDFHGYVPEYPSPAVDANFLLSEQIGNSPLGFVERNSSPVHWSTVDDLRGTTMGVVRGYVNTTAIDSMLASGEIRAVPAADDLSNLRNVMSGRVPLAIIDRQVLSYLIQNAPGIADARRVLQFNPRLLENRTLHVALQRSVKGRWALREINMGLRNIDIDAIVAPYFPTVGR